MALQQLAASAAVGKCDAKAKARLRNDNVAFSEGVDRAWAKEGQRVLPICE